MKVEEYIPTRLAELCKQHKMTKYRLSKITGLSQTTLANIFAGRTQPTFSSLSLICDAFGISLVQFFSDNSDYSGLSEQQASLLTAWSTLPADKRELLLKFLNSLQ